MYDILGQMKQLESMGDVQKNKTYSLVLGDVPICAVCGAEWQPSVDFLFELLTKVYRDGVDFLRDGSICTYELMQHKSDLIGVLPFPMDCLAIVRNNTVVQIDDAEGQPLLK